MSTKRALCTLLAVLLTAAATLLMFPNWLLELYPEADFSGTFVNLEELDIRHFPLYGNVGGDGSEKGISDLLQSYESFITEGTEPAPNIFDKLGEITAQDGFLQILYSFVFISLLTIPVYMLLRLLLYNAVYEAAEHAVWILRPFARGLVAASASAVTVFGTWFLYKTLVFNLIFDYLKNTAEKLFSDEKFANFALNATNIVILVVLAIGVFALLHRTLFRGSISLSVLGALMRTLLFVILVSSVNVFIGSMTLRTILFMLAALLVIGIMKDIFFKDNKRSRASSR